ncbi:MAG TPA: diguanylate cyclase, partial [Candidatus Bathyarchaeia archaeon]|nr:diguanylate cyclase [Candidatus Bathyarchaeia archaeon]
MFGTRLRPARPVLLILVYGAFIALVGITAAAQSVLVGAHFSTSTLEDIVGSDSATTRAFVNAYLKPSDLAGPTALSGADAAHLDAQLATLVRPGEVLRVELRLPDGTIVAASDPALRGASAPATDDFIAAAGGASQARMTEAADAGSGPGTLGSPTVLREFLPITVGGKVLGVVGIWRDAVPILARLDRVRLDVVIVTISAGIVAAALLYLVFRAAQGRLTRQTEALLEASRRDPLTGTMNHGTVVGELAVHLEAARASGRPVGIALVDIDNIRLLNDNHGHAAGDAALLTVAGALERQSGPDTLVGRYGPDEFLLVAEGASIANIESIVERTRTALADASLRFEATERLPVTVSAGLATYPVDGASVTALLSAAATVLEEAKASGGDTIRRAGPAPEAAPGAATFDLFQGLVIAVDTKDRYTRRHSEDVARYSIFLAERLGLDDELIRTIRVAGLLHDVGKIGIPDHILRKPGKLTAVEYDIVKEHVALGDMIVRGLPDIDQVRAGVRYHHERWDGEGYLDRLAGEEIPLIARVLAVSDAFSAMTTTRPYRKALDLREALTRLGDAAGTQL